MLKGADRWPTLTHPPHSGVRTCHVHRLDCRPVPLMHPVESPATGCEDTDCKGDRICESGACVSPGSRKRPPENAPPQRCPVRGRCPPRKMHRPRTVPPPQTMHRPRPTTPKIGGKRPGEVEAPVLQAIFNRMPNPIIRKDNGKLVYQRAVPLVVADVHNTTAAGVEKPRSASTFGDLEDPHHHHAGRHHRRHRRDSLLPPQLRG